MTEHRARYVLPYHRVLPLSRAPRATAGGIVIIDCAQRVVKRMGQRECAPQSAMLEMEWQLERGAAWTDQTQGLRAAGRGVAHMIPETGAAWMQRLFALYKDAIWPNAQTVEVRDYNESIRLNAPTGRRQVFL